MNKELLKRMVKSFRVRDDEAFTTAVRQIIQSERKQGHNQLAADLEKILANGAPAHGVPAQRETDGQRLSPGAPPNGAPPKNKAEGVSLVDVRRSSKTLNDIVLDPECQRGLMRFLEEFSKQKALAEYGLEPKRKLLFFGPPGNGKTLCAEVIAGEMDLPLFYVRFDALVASYLGETAANLRRVFDYASAGLGILFFDEVDAIGKSRDDRGDVGELKRVVSSFLQLLDGYQGKSPVIAATNYENILDYALWRRFDDLLYFPKATQEQLVKYLSYRLSGFRLDGFTVTEAADWCENRSFSDVARITTDAIKTMALKKASAITIQMFRESVEYQRSSETQHSPGRRAHEGGR